MAGMIKKKSTLFSKYSDGPAMPPSPLSVSIRAAENGYVVRCAGGDDKTYDGKENVAGTIAAVLKIVKEHLKSDDEEDSKDGGKDEKAEGE